MNEQQCPCGSGDSYSACCEPYHTGSKYANTAEALMRSRYTAYARGDSAYLYKTWHSRTQPKSINLNDDGSMQWQRLEVINTEAGQRSDDTGVVEFKAHFSVSGKPGVLHERSEFSKENGTWFYLDGETPKSDISPAQVDKTGRNDPCPCGSGNKYKKCCMP
ncbi:MAG: YchJ family protein [Gammaproteobacteria bacterium]|nr:YchJ family protein [Gammaproteobacteria bacterium]